jgi:hypothetical protein
MLLPTKTIGPAGAALTPDVGDSDEEITNAIAATDITGSRWRDMPGIVVELPAAFELDSRGSVERSKI